MKPIYSVAVTMAFVAALSSCGDELPEPMLKPRTAVTVQTDWSGCGLESEPKTYYMEINGEAFNVSGSTIETTLKSDNDYVFMLYSGTANVTVADSCIKVEGTKFVTGHADAINGNPETVCCGYAYEPSLTGDTKVVSVSMRRVMRKMGVTLNYKETAGSNATLQGGYAMLTNVCSAYDIPTGTVSAPVTAVSEIAYDKDGGVISVPFNLMGFAEGSKVSITFVLSLSDGTTSTITSDITSLVSSFGDGSTAELGIKAQAELSGLSFGITDWEIVSGGDIQPEINK